MRQDVHRFRYTHLQKDRIGMTPEEQVELDRQRDQLLGQATMVMAATDSTGAVEMGVTPFVRYDGGLFIYPSQLSRHVRALLDRGAGQFLVADDEGDTTNKWARRRLKFTATIDNIARDSDEFSRLCAVFAERHGPTMDVIRAFSDFHMLRLRPETGVMVLGFASAYELVGENLQVVRKLQSG